MKPRELTSVSIVLALLIGLAQGVVISARLQRVAVGPGEVVVPRAGDGVADVGAVSSGTVVKQPGDPVAVDRAGAAQHLVPVAPAPLQEDFQGVTVGLLRLQHTYNLSTIALMNGIVYGELIY